MSRRGGSGIGWPAGSPQLQESARVQLEVEARLQHCGTIDLVRFME